MSEDKDKDHDAAKQEDNDRTDTGLKEAFERLDKRQNGRVSGTGGPPQYHVPRMGLDSPLPFSRRTENLGIEL
jgi:hypothetical protein